MKGRIIGVAAALITTPLIALPAWAAPCPNAPVATYTTPGFSCSVDGVTFSNIVLNTVTSGTGFVIFGNFTPFTLGGEFGLALNYLAETGATPGSVADVAWTYNVSGNLLSDAFLSLAANTTGTGQSQVTEVLSNGTTLSLK